MKKLIISIVATASIALVAKADVAPNATSFETYPENVAFDVGRNDNGGEGGYIFWSGGDAGSEFLIKALAEGEKGTAPRPKYWDGTTPDAKALSIDTDVALSRHVNADRIAQDIGTGLYFDSMVQFTATDTPPTVEANTSDKLVVWLKEIEGSEGQPSTYKLCVTAGVWDELGNITVTPFENTNPEIAISKDEWCRLTISVSKDSDGYPLFEVRVNGKLFTAEVEKEGEEVEVVSQFMSLAYTAEDAKTISSVSFQGKGVIDDLVWTTEDPIADSYTVIVTDELAGVKTFKYMIGNEKSADITLNFDGLDDVTGEAEISVPAGTKALTVILGDLGDYELQGGTKTADGWVKPFTTLVKGEPLELVVIEAVPVAKIGDVTYTTLQAAVDAATAGAAEITVIADIVTDGPVTVDKQVTIHLGGKRITATNDKSGDGVFHVVAGGNLTLNGEGTVNALGPNDWCMAVWADGGTVTINGGTYTNVGATSGDDSNHFDLIYVKNGGKVFINNGTFICQTVKWTLNSNNIHDKPGSFEVRGGSFYGYDPSNPQTDDPVISWCAPGYEATLDTKTGYYTVAEKTIEPVTPGESATVEAKTEDDALAKVKLSVTVPEAFKGEVSDEVYKGYFELKATEASSGTWIVEAVLKDEVKPVIEATTDKEGVVTPAISFGTDGTVTINISNELPGLYYGVKYATTVGGVETAEIIPDLTVTPKEGDTAGFFRVVVDFKEIPAPAADAE